MKGAHLSGYAAGRLKEIIKARGLTAFAEQTGVNIETLKKLAGGGYTYQHIVERVETAFTAEVKAEAIVELVAERLEVDRAALTQPAGARHQRYFGTADLPAPLKGKWICCFLIYKEASKASLRSVAAVVGYSHPDWVRDIILKVYDMLDTDAAFRRQVLSLQTEAARLGLK